MKFKRFGALLLSAVLCIGIATPAFAYEGDTTPVEQPVLPEVVEEDTVTITDEESGALTPEGNLTLVDDYHTNYSDGSGQQFITLVSKSGATFYLVIDRNAKGQQTVHFMNLVDEADLLALMEEEDAEAYNAEKKAVKQAELDKLKAEEEAKKAAEEAEKAADVPKENKMTKYARWAKKYNLKEMSKTLIFLQEKKIGSIKEMQERVDAATARYHELGDSIKVAETRMAEIAVLRTHIVNYAKTRPVYDAYRKAGYSKRFLENYRAEITLHKAAKAAFNEANLKKLPKVKELDAEYSKLLTEKKAVYPDYRKAKDEMQELLRAQRNVELFFAEEKNTTEKVQFR